MNAAELQEKGTKLFMQRDYEAAAEAFKQAKAAYDAEGKPDMAAEMQVNLGLIESRFGNYDEAINYMGTARQFFLAQQDRRREAMVAGNIGSVYLAQGNLEQAYTLYREAADSFKELGDNERYGQTLIDLAQVQAKTGKWLEAAATYEVAIDLISNPNFRQKMIKRLLKIRNGLIGGGTPKVEEVEDDTK